MGTSTIMLAFQMTAEADRNDVCAVIPEVVSLLMDDVIVVYPSKGGNPSDGVLVALGNQGKSMATARYHSNGLLTVDIQHECEEHELHPLSGPHTFGAVGDLNRQVKDRLGHLCQRSASLCLPVRRTCRPPNNYAATADDRLIETDYTHTLCDVISPFQRVSILQSRQFGRVLTLNDDVMYGESDEIYVTTVLGLDRGNKFGGATVLILGGGDGGLLHRLTSLPDPPSHVLMVEIDEEVMKASRKYMRSVCGHVLDTYKTDSYEIQVRDCVEVLQESVTKGDKYDYVINDLTEELVVTGSLESPGSDLKAGSVLLELSFLCLKDGGKYLARNNRDSYRADTGVGGHTGDGESAQSVILEGDCVSAGPLLQQMETELRALGATLTHHDVHVPSYREIYRIYEAQMAATDQGI